MCFICDGGTREDLERRITGRIIEKGWSIQGVQRQDGRLDWAYTIGLAQRFGHPELAVTGTCCPGCTTTMLDQAAALVAAGRRLAVGDLLDLSSPLRVGPVHPQQWDSDRFALWLAYYASRPTEPPREALQLIWVEQDGAWQDAPGKARWRRERLDLAPGAGLTARTGAPSNRQRHRRQRRRRRARR
jgi:hypothetical protein